MHHTHKAYFYQLSLHLLDENKQDYHSGTHDYNYYKLLKYYILPFNSSNPNRVLNILYNGKICRLLSDP